MKKLKKNIIDVCMLQGIGTSIQRAFTKNSIVCTQ